MRVCVCVRMCVYVLFVCLCVCVCAYVRVVHVYVRVVQDYNARTAVVAITPAHFVATSIRIQATAQPDTHDRVLAPVAGIRLASSFVRRCV